eukprot:gene3889-13955_t
MDPYCNVRTNVPSIFCVGYSDTRVLTTHELSKSVQQSHSQLAPRHLSQLASEYPSQRIEMGSCESKNVANPAVRAAQPLPKEPEAEAPAATPPPPAESAAEELPDRGPTPRESTEPAAAQPLDLVPEEAAAPVDPVLEAPEETREETPARDPAPEETPSPADPAPEETPSPVNPAPEAPEEETAAPPAPVAPGDHEFTLKPHANIPLAEGPVMVCILDGWGDNEYKDEWNAVHMAQTPIMDGLSTVPNRWRSVKAHGRAVGLPSDADMGNSEVGHNALGSGQVVDQGARLVDIALETGQMFEGAGWKLISGAFAENAVHFIGLLSDGGVHSRTDQLYGCIRGAANGGAKKIRVHILTDGRDVPDGSSLDYIAKLEAELASVSEGGVDAKIASGGGRMGVTMDRYESDWDIVKRGWDAHVLGKAPHTFTDCGEAVKTLRGSEDKQVSDQNLDPFVIVDEEGNPVGTIEDGDAVVVFNFRADRMVQMSKALEYEEFTSFDRERFPKTLFVGMMQYDGDLKLPANYLVTPPAIMHVSGEHLCKNNISTFACSETQKFGHVTFFWNGNRSGYFNADLETYVEIPSDKIMFNEKPEMKALEISEASKEALKSGKFKMVRVNFANPDMVGHTGDLPATITACEVVDKCVGELIELVNSLNGRWLVTSDHGNADDMVQRNKKGEPLMGEDGKALPLTSHTLAPVPVAIGGSGLPDTVVFRDDLPEAGLANVTATTIALLGYEPPSIYEAPLIA